MSRIISLRDAIEAASVSALLPKCSAIWSLCETTVSVSLLPMSSSFDTISPPRRLRSRTIDSPVVLSELFTSSARDAMVSRCGPWCRSARATRLGAVRDRLGELARADVDRIQDRGALLREAVHDLIEASGQRLLQVGGDRKQLLVEVIGFEVEPDVSRSPAASIAWVVSSLVRSSASGGRRRARRAHRSWRRRRRRAPP